MIVLYLYPKWWPYRATAIFFFVIAKRGQKLGGVSKHHELIHLEQQREMFWALFFVWYLVEFIVRLFMYGFKWSKAYRNISFEREARYEEQNFRYIAVNRKPWNWIKFLNSKKGK